MIHVDYGLKIEPKCSMHQFDITERNGKNLLVDTFMKISASGPTRSWDDRGNKLLNFFDNSWKNNF